MRCRLASTTLLSWFSVWGLMWLVTTSAALADLKLEHVRATKKATALVLSRQGQVRGQGSAFCIAPGVFVTNAHVVANAPSPLSLVVNSGEKDQQVIQAKILRSDRELDFALLQVEVSKDAALPESISSLPALELGSSDELVETMSLTAFGFPFGTALAFENGEYPSASVSVGRITSLRKKLGVLERIQLDATLNPGNSGGAIVDDSGRVVAVVQSGIPGAGVNFAIPVTNLKKFLDRPEVTVTVPPVPFDKQHEEHELTVSVATFRPAKTDYTAELTVGDGELQTVKLVENTGKFRFVPVAKPKGLKQFRLTFKFPTGFVMGITDDRTLTVGSEKIELIRIRRIDNLGDQVKVSLSDNNSVTGKLASEKAVMRLGPAEVSVDMAHADSVVVESLDRPIERVPYSVEIKEGMNAIALSKGLISILKPGATAPASSTNKSLASTELPRPTPMPMPMPTTRPGSNPSTPPVTANVSEPDDASTIKMVGLIDDVVAGHGGKYLFFQLKQVGKVAVFDVESREITKYLTVGTGEVAIAAGESALLVLHKDRNIIERFNLTTLERELSVPCNETAGLHSLSLGYDCSGPALLLTHKGPRLVDLTTLKSKSIPLASDGSRLDMETNQVRASADGTTYGVWRTATSPSGFITLTLAGESGTEKYEHKSVGAICPSFDGRILMTATGLFSTDLKPIGPNELRQQYCFPTYHRNFFWATPNGAYVYPHPSEARRPRIGLYTFNDFTPLLSFDLFPELIEPNGINSNTTARSNLSWDKRVHYFPAKNLLVTIPSVRDRLVIRPLDLKEALRKTDLDYFFVNSSPPTVASKGEHLSYQVEVESKRRGVQFKLDSGPDGMTLSPAGKLEWLVPLTQSTEPVVVIISVKNAVGQELLHSFTMQVK